MDIHFILWVICGFLTAIIAFSLTGIEDMGR